jgi:hypothetical protein
MSYSSEVLADAPAAYFRMDQVSGLLADSTANGNHNTLVTGTATYSQPSLIASDLASTSVRFTGSQDFRSDDSATLDLGDVFTLECWGKRDATQGTVQTMICKDVGAYQLAWFTDNKLILARNGVAIIVSSTLAITDTTTAHHLVCTKNGATVKLYIDGVDRTGTVTNSTFVNNTSQLTIGSNGALTPGELYSGWLDEVAVYPTALSLARVQAHYNAAVSGSAQAILPDADLAFGGWTTAPLFSKVNDASDATLITATAS